MKRKQNIRQLDHSRQFTEWFTDIYELHFEKLYRYAFSITKSRQLAEDVVAEVFMNIWNKKPDYSHIRELNSYLHVAVKHLALRLVSKDIQNFSLSNYDETLRVTDTIDPESLLLGKELEKIINKTVVELTPHTRIVYEMVKNKGFSYEKVGNELGISKRTVESHMHIALGKLKEVLYAHFKESGKTYNLIARISIIAVLIICFPY